MKLSLDSILKVRVMTGASIDECKNALNATDGNVDEAVEYMKKIGVAKAVSVLNGQAEKIVAEEGKSETATDLAEDERTTTVINDSSAESTSTVADGSAEARPTMVIGTSPEERSTMVMDGSPEERPTTVTGERTGFDRSTVCLDSDEHFVAVENLIGEKIDDEYTLVSVISSKSGQSVVYLAKKTGSKKSFVCKLYRDDATVIDPRIVQALATEIDNPHVIKVLKFGTYRGRYYTITPFYEEGSVIEHIEEIDCKRLKDSYIEQLNEGLHAIHNAGILHCDIKPHNILFSNGHKELVIADFGIAIYTDNFDTIKGVAGAAVPKRQLQKNNATRAYLAPEGDEYASQLVDYYALGLTILNMAHRGDVYEGVKDEEVRDRLFWEGAYITDDVDAEIGMLVVNMTKRDHVERIGYEGVKEWCNNHARYGKYVKNVKSACAVNITSAVFNGNVYTTTEEYTQALQSNYDEAIEYFLRDGIVNDLARAGADKELIKRVSAIRTAYGRERDTGLLLTLMEINPMTKFSFGPVIDFDDFKGYIAYLDGELCKGGTPYFNKDIILKNLENELKTGRISGKGTVLTIVTDVCDSAYDNYYKACLLRNYFTTQDDVIMNRTRYSLGELGYLMFGKDIVPSAAYEFFNPLFAGMLRKFTEVKDKVKDFDKIFAISDSFTRNGKMALFLSGCISTTIGDVRISCFADIVSYAKSLYENDKRDKAKLCLMLRNGKIRDYYMLFPNPDASVVKLLNFVAGTRFPNDADLLTYFYNQTQKFAVFMFEGKRIDGLQGLFDYLAIVPDIAAVSHSLLNSAQFEMWLNGSGYGECVRLMRDKT